MWFWGRGEDRRASLVEEKRESVVSGRNTSVHAAPTEIPAAQALQVPKASRARELPTRAARLTKQIQVMSHEPHDAVTHQTLEKVRAHLIMRSAVDGFSHVVKQGRSPELRLIRLATSELKDLQRVKQRVALRMIARRLKHAIQPNKTLQKIRVHL